MAKFTFLDIRKANAEIERLEAELTRVTAAAQAAEAKTAAAEAINTQLAADLDTAKQTLSTLGEENAKLAECLEATARGLAAARETIANPPAQIKEAAAREAQAIAAAQGISPLPVKADAEAREDDGTDGNGKVLNWTKYAAAQRKKNKA